jgi:hypothetical protein
MKRVTKKVRKVLSKGAREHLVFTSEKHAQDKASADRLREARYVRVPTEPRLAPEPFPRAGEIAGQVVFAVSSHGEHAGKNIGKKTTPENYKAHLSAAARDASEWYVPTKKLKKNGKPQLQKRRGQGLSDCYFSFAPWVSEQLAEMVEAGQLKEARNIIQAAVNKARKLLESRTQYRVVGLAIHPDSRGSIGYHIQYKTAEGGKLLGRSATGKRGGLRLAGDAMSGVARMAAYVKVDDRFGVLEKDCDDLAINAEVDTFCRDVFGPDIWDVVEARAQKYSEDWKRRREEALSGPEEVARLKAEVERLETKLERGEQAVLAVLDREEPSVKDRILSRLAEAVERRKTVKIQSNAQLL